MKSLVIGIDFDGTMVTHRYPEIGTPLENAVETIHRLMEAGHKIILYTVRDGERLAQAVEYMEENDIELWGVNKNPTQHHWTKSPKIFCNLVIDDDALGVPSDTEASGRLIVDWYKVEEMLDELGYFDDK